MPLDELFHKIRVLQDFDLEEECLNAIVSSEQEITELMRLQLMKGKDADDEPVMLLRRGGAYDYYSDSTIREKERYGDGLGAVTDTITHYMTGALYGTLQIKIDGKEFHIESDVSYFNDVILHNKSGIKLMELNQKNRRWMIDNVIVPKVRASFTAKFNK